MGTAHQKPRQQNFAFAQSKSEHRFSHGGVLFQRRSGRKARPLSSRDHLHLVFKARKDRLRSGSLRSSQNFKLIYEILRKYAKRFFVKVEQVSIQGDHIHLLIRTSRRSYFHFFFRVVAGQIAQRFEQEAHLRAPPKNEAPLKAPPNNDSLRDPSIKSRAVIDTPTQQGTRLWKYRPFSRVVRGWRAYKIVRDYIQLNEKEVRGEIPYRKERLKGLSSSDWQILWT
jgi:putative transposase